MENSSDETDSLSDISSSLELTESAKRRLNSIARYIPSDEEEIIDKEIPGDTNKVNTDTENSSSKQISRITTRQSIVQSLKELSRMVTEGDASQGDFLATSKSNISIIDTPTPNEESYLVSYDGPGDEMHPFNWALSKKLRITIIVSVFSFSNSLDSAIFTEATDSLIKDYEISNVVATLATSIFVFGFALGPIIWGPMSELFGRRLVLIPASFGLTIFTFAIATAKDIQTIMICRFFAGCCGGAAMVLSASTIGDMFAPRYRGRAMAPFGITVCGGPMLGPIIGGFTVKNPNLSWRWTAYFSAFISSFVFVLIVLFLSETYHPVVLSHKAKILRAQTGNWALHSPQERISLSPKEICVKYLARPFYMLFTEPILAALAFYGGFVYGLIYLLLIAIPLVFTENYHFSQGARELPYFSSLIGCILGACVLILFDIRYKKLTEKLNGASPGPRERLPSMMVGSFGFTIGLFLFCWSGDYPSQVHWIVPTIGCAFIGFGLLTIFQPCINYVVDCFTVYSASCLAAMTVVRSVLAGCFPLFARHMFLGMHFKWAGTLLGCISALLIPVPFVFYKYDSKIRRKSKFAKS